MFSREVIAEHASNFLSPRLALLDFSLFMVPWQHPSWRPSILFTSFEIGWILFCRVYQYREFTKWALCYARTTDSSASKIDISQMRDNKVDNYSAAVMVDSLYLSKIKMLSMIVLAWSK